MAIIIANGKYYIYLNENKGCRKTEDRSKATVFANVDEAVKCIKDAPTKTRSYYVYDTETKVKVFYGKCKKGKNRKHYSTTTRKMLYNKYDGVCQLCGKKLTIKDMTLDHIVPLACGGIDDINNIQIACEQCNWLKADSLPDDFANRVTNIFMYQMDKKRKGNFMWEISSAILRKII